jgi:hypothetical protein
LNIPGGVRLESLPLQLSLAVAESLNGKESEKI